MAFWAVRLSGRHDCAWKKREHRTGWTSSDWGRIATTIIWHVTRWVPVIDHGDYRLCEGQICIAEFDRLIGNQAYFIGDHLSLADLMLAPQLDFFYGTREGREMLEGTALAEWLKRMNERSSMQRTQRPEPLRAAA
jgi:Glutathione S-transferase, C-terminal domain